MAFIEIEINNWSRFNPRKDFKRPTWFALDNRIVESPSMLELTADEFRAWIYILCQASQKNSGTIKVYFQHADRVCKISKKAVLAAIEKMVRDGSVRHLYASVQITNASVQDLYATDRQTDTTDTPKRTSSVHQLAALWNKHTTGFKKVIKTQGKRLAACEKLWGEYDIPDWVAILERLNQSTYCQGKVPGKTWVATFDWFIKPESVTKILEGTYDDRAHAGPVQVVL